MIEIASIAIGLSVAIIAAWYGAGYRNLAL